MDFFGGRIWHENIASVDGVDVQALPQITSQLGNTTNYTQTGVIVRFGQGLDSDFGALIIEPELSGMDAYTPLVHLFGMCLAAH